MENDEDFVVYLRSVSNLEDFPDNKATCFTNIINPPRRLINEYEVSLQNIFFEPSYDPIIKNSNLYKIELYIKLFTEDDSEISLNSIGIRYRPTANIKGDNYFQAIQNLNEDFTSYLIQNEIIDEYHPTIFRFDTYMHIIRFTNIIPPQDSKFKKYSIVWKFSREMSHFLGLLESSNFTESPIFSYPGKISGPKLILVYTNIVEPSNIGSQNVNILDIHPMPEMHAKSMVDIIYKSVNRTLLDNINIQLCDQFGEPIPFKNDVVVTAILHFRTKK